jgi:hypothetical protein
LTRRGITGGWLSIGSGESSSSSSETRLRRFVTLGLSWSSSSPPSSASSSPSSAVPSILIGRRFAFDAPSLPAGLCGFSSSSSCASSSLGVFGFDFFGAHNPAASLVAGTPRAAAS